MSSCWVNLSLIIASGAIVFSVVFIILTGVLQLWPAFIVSWFPLLVSFFYLLTSLKYKFLSDKNEDPGGSSLLPERNQNTQHESSNDLKAKLPKLSVAEVDSYQRAHQYYTSTPRSNLTARADQRGMIHFVERSSMPSQHSSTDLEERTEDLEII